MFLNVKKIMRLLFVAVSLLAIAFIALWFLFLSPPRFIIQMTLPDNAKYLAGSFDDVKRTYNQRIQEQYANGMKGYDLTKQLTKEGYTVKVVAKQEKETDQPYCSTTSWTVYADDVRQKRMTGSMGSHRQVCAKMKKMQHEYVSGTSLPDLVKQLREDGFEVTMLAIIRRNKFPCGLKWSVSWVENKNTKVRDISGKFSYNCI